MKDWRPRCVKCSKYCGYLADMGNRYGCADPGDPEPYDPDYWCKVCAKKEEAEMVKSLLENPNSKTHKPYWIMPHWANNALKKAGWGLSKEPHMIEKLTCA